MDLRVLQAISKATGWLVALTLAGCTDIFVPPPENYFDQAPLVQGSPAEAGGHVLYRLLPSDVEPGEVERLSLMEGAKPESVSRALDVFSKGEDLHAATSPNGRWIVVVTTRFGCTDHPCMALVSGDLVSVRRIRTQSGQVPEAQTASVSDDGHVVAYSAPGNHGADVFVVIHEGDLSRPTPWNEPMQVSAESSFAFNRNPRISPDGGAVTFECGAKRAEDSPRSLCDAAVDGRGLRVRVASDKPPADARQPIGQLRFPQPLSDFGGRSLLFEADWSGYPQLFRVDGDGDPKPVALTLNDGSPCALPDGRVASLWAGRAANRQGLHEVKVVGADGQPRVLRRDRDAMIGTLSCSQ